MANSDSKGKRGERQLCRKLREHGFGAIRSAQVTGAKDHSHSADIITSLDPEIRFEVKRGYEDTSITSKKFKEWCHKALRETPDSKHTVLAWRKNRQPWVLFRVHRAMKKLDVWIGVKSFYFDLFDLLGTNPEEYKVEDPSTWKTTDTFS